MFTKPESVRTGINIFLDGYVPMDNIRFRDHPILFEKEAPTPSPLGQNVITEYMKLVKKWGSFEVTVEPGAIYDGEVLGVLGANAIGKTTLMGILSGYVEPDSGGFMVKAESISYKPQYIQVDFQDTVDEFILDVVGEKALSGFAKNALLEPLNMVKLFERKVSDLSGGELQKLNISTCLLKDADVYILDEPSAFIDVEDRLTVASSINRFIKLQGRAGVVVDHDMIIVNMVSDRIIVFEGIPGSWGHALHPMGKRRAFNTFLRSLDVTIRRDKHSGRPRINKPDSRLDRRQKDIGEFYFES
jgi:ATP-binding cassette subfamily E protein 1